MAMWSSCEAVVANVAETVVLDYVNALVITNKSGADLYVKFEWTGGDTEVSSANFDTCISNGGVFSMTADTPTFPVVTNMRVISTGSGRIAAIGW